MRWAIFALVLLCAIPASAQKYAATIVDRQERENYYIYVVPGYAPASADQNCTASGSEITCGAPSKTDAEGAPIQNGSFYVRGTTLSLRLPDGRIAVVTCDLKFAPHLAGMGSDHKYCNEPLGNDLQADIHGDIAMLEWTVQSDGKKKPKQQSEKYKVVAILDRPKRD